MIEIGYKLCSEEHGPNDLVKYAQRAEEVGFTFAMISDHYHPWTDRQGQSPFTSRVMTCALLPFALALGLDLFVAGERVVGPLLGTTIGVLAIVLAITLWYGLEAIDLKRHTRHNAGSVPLVVVCGTGLLESHPRTQASAPAASASSARMIDIFKWAMC